MTSTQSGQTALGWLDPQFNDPLWATEAVDLSRNYLNQFSPFTWCNISPPDCSSYWITHFMENFDGW